MEYTIQYIDMDLMYQELVSLFTEARDSMIDDQNQEFIMGKYEDAMVAEDAMETTSQINNQMKRYLHGEHKICGNFNNIDYDYPNFRGKGVNYDHELVADMIARLDANDQSEQTQKDREFLVSWFFETFGTYGIKYNYTDRISADIYDYQHNENVWVPWYLDEKHGSSDIMEELAEYLGANQIIRGSERGYETIAFYMPMGRTTSLLETMCTSNVIRVYAHTYIAAIKAVEDKIGEWVKTLTDGDNEHPFRYQIELNGDREIVIYLFKEFLENY